MGQSKIEEQGAGELEPGQSYISAHI